MKVITAETLKKHRRDEIPCKSQIRKFKKLFPDGARLTLKNLRLAVDNNLDVLWAMGTILSRKVESKLDKELLPEFRKLSPECWDEGRSRYKEFRKFQKVSIPALWRAIKLDRESK